MFTVRKELTPSVNGDTKCSVYLNKKLDYEIHASYIMQIIAEVNTHSMKSPLFGSDTMSTLSSDHPVCLKVSGRSQAVSGL